MFATNPNAYTLVADVHVWNDWIFGDMTRSVVSTSGAM